MANFGFAAFPATVKVDERAFRPYLSGWSWSGFCKTAYSARLERGGVEDFPKCHLAIVSILDFADSLGIFG